MNQDGDTYEKPEFTFMELRLLNEIVEDAISEMAEKGHRPSDLLLSVREKLRPWP
jgi:hypothetical protein